ncbi:ABC transporter permease [Microlunatus soli]|uniref:Multiple sugar transport system permease protein n=1 Tax=Microlunatus soli TaxID=630515 RepID=A0A1H1VQF1_9ACTN|nr:ABC transporter permease subunit [Microlunatus soli]SDS86905.1 multiple sugar transport system permease protein [Microlunatus soli]
MTAVQDSSTTAVADRAAPPRRRARLGGDWRLAWIFLAPTAVLVGALILFPIVYSVVLSTTQRHGSETVFVGLANFAALVHDRLFYTGVKNSFVFTVYSEIFKVTAGLVAALLLHNLRRGRAIVAGVLLLPWVVPTIVTAFTWRSLLDPIFGSVNTVLTVTGIGPFLASINLINTWPAAWLSDPTLAMPSVIMVNVWKGIPFFAVNFLAGLKAIDSGLYEAAMVDGASVWSRFVHVTLPGLRYVIIVTTLLSSIWTFNNFDLVWLMTQGGPGDATAPYVLVAYTKAIQQLQFGPGAASTLVLLPVVGVLVVLLVRMMRSGDQRTAPRRERLSAPQRRGIMIAVVIVGLIVLALAGPTFFWRAAVLLGVPALLVLVVGWLISWLAARGSGRASRLLQGAGTGVVLAVLMGFVLAPLYWIVVTAFKSDLQITSRMSDLWPTPWSAEQFIGLFTDQPFGIWYRNTLIVSISSTALTLVCASLGGYALARLRFRGANSFTTTILLTYVMPGALLFIPLYRLLSGVHLTDSLWSLFLTYPTFTLPFATWLLMGYFRSIPIDLEEAALTDGCSRFQAFRKIVLPLAKPGLLAVALFTLTNAWNEFLFAFVLITKDELKTLPVGMQSMIFGDVVPQGELAVASLLISLPVVLMYAFGQRFLTEGLTAGAVKG